MDSKNYCTADKFIEAKLSYCKESSRQSTGRNYDNWTKVLDPVKCVFVNTVSCQSGGPDQLFYCRLKFGCTFNLFGSSGNLFDSPFFYLFLCHGLRVSEHASRREM